MIKKFLKECMGFIRYLWEGFEKEDPYKSKRRPYTDYDYENVRDEYK